MTLAFAAPGSGPVPYICTNTFLVIKDRCLCDVDEVCEECRDTANGGDQNPTLSGIEQEPQASPNVFPTTQFSLAESVGDAVVDPVRGGELVIPDSFVLIRGPQQ